MNLPSALARCFHNYRIEQDAIVAVTQRTNCVLTEGEFVLVQVSRQNEVLYNDYLKWDYSGEIKVPLQASGAWRQLSVLARFYNLEEEISSKRRLDSLGTAAVLASFGGVMLLSGIIVCATSWAYSRVMRPRISLPK